MRLDKMVLDLSPASLELTDFTVFTSRFTEIVSGEIPTAQTVYFFTRSSFANSSFPLSHKEKNKYFNRVQKQNNPEVIDRQSILIPVQVNGDEPLAILVTDIDETVVKRMSADWLEERTTALSEQFLSIKQAWLEPTTNLYNSTLLKELVTSVPNSLEFHVVIVEMSPQSRLPRDIFTHARHVTRSFIEFNRLGFPLFHLGYSVFALFVPDKKGPFIKSFCLSLITFMKNRRFKRIHCGCSGYHNESTELHELDPKATNVIDQAWTALHTACRRGPFAFCDFDLLAHPEHFPLKRLPRSTTAKLQRRWKDSDTHALVFFVPDYKKPGEMADIVVRFFGQHNFVMAESGFFVIRRHSYSEESKVWAQSLIDRLIDECGDGCSLSAGISEFPFSGFNKTEIIRNCQKAILHGDFFGFGSVVIFDAVSLNISGDIYFGEGDLSGAVREYRCGLEFDPTDVNLLNSLGVTYALMNRVRQAQAAFQNVLNYDPVNFMALYNRGLGEQDRSHHDKAIHYYVRALDAHSPDDEDAQKILIDLIYQLGIAYYHNYEFQKSIQSLEQWYEQQEDNKSRGKCCRFIGVAYFKMNKSVDSMTWLQRALAFDEEDSEALSILGLLYLSEKEGDDIAFKLMEKSLELAPDNYQYLLRYAEGLNRCSRYEEALFILKKCTRNQKSRDSAWFEISIAFKGLKKYNKVRYYLNKLVEKEKTDPIIKVKARQLYSEITTG